MIGLSLAGCGGSSSNDPVTPPTENTIQKQVAALISTSTGNSIAHANIKIAGQSFTTDIAGKANFSVNIPQNAQYVVVQIEKAGFVSQSLRVKATELESISANLIAVKNVIEVPAIEKAQIIESSELNASIAIPANAFVRPNGQVAIGKVIVEFSPWDIQSDDLNAMPANGVAQNAQNQIVDLISAGMISATFKNEQGETLQLAKGKKADLMMDLPVNSIADQTMTVGTQIPMWYFDEAKGLWVEEGVGHVVQSVDGNGLAVHAAVTHFSTWNWDFQYLGAATVFVQCFAENIAAPCHVTANTTLEDGSKISRSGYIPTQGTQIINMPGNGTINWLARHTDDDTLAEVSSVIPNRVRIDLVPAKTNNLVSCVKDNIAVDCTVELNGREYYVAKEGSHIRTMSTATNLSWTARSQYFEGTTAVYRDTGVATSANTGNVVIDLNQRSKLFDKTPFDLRCDFSGESNLPCAVSLYTSTEQYYGYKNYTLPINQSLTVYLPVPSPSSNINFWIDTTATVRKGELMRYAEYDYDQIEQQKLHFNFNNTEWCSPWDGGIDSPDVELPREDGDNICWQEMPS
jgi:hypothetical protein